MLNNCSYNRVEKTSGPRMVSRRLSIRSAQVALHEHQLMLIMLGYYRDENGSDAPETALVC
ncbi:MAG: hypothetical protein GF403_09525 [Candidatus Coatesbacteria bacterium]|nr:hypothetical protein [Candidatus Coatesbacteria bacterium]